ncbi:phasin family protein [Rhodoferax sp.]|uniref:phasin family protein n=1 Tax=Rhodoferax sp. TaxID=50421 RepID=UPI00374D78EF
MPTTPTRRATRMPAVKQTAAKTAVVKGVVVKPKSKAPLAKAKAHAAAKTTTLKQVSAQGRRKVSSVVHLTRDASLKLIDSQRAIWLAGLGALAKVTTSTGTKGEKAFEALVKAGEKIESQARNTIDSNANMLKHRINDASKVVDDSINSVGDAFDARVKQALARLGYPKAKKTTK